MQRAIDDFIKTADRLPSMPGQVSSLLQTMGNPGSSIAQVETMIAADSTLSARILKLANSAFYYRMTPVTRIRDALTRLGFKSTRSMVVTVWTQSLVAFARNRRDAATVSQLLSHGTACAVIAKAVCETLRRDGTEDVFLAGLLHDLGRLALVCQLGDSYLKDVLAIAERDKRASCLVEEEVLGLNHALLGSRLMEAWRLPALFVEVARGHHVEGIDAKAHPELAMVALADAWATELGYNLARGALRPAAEPLVAMLAIPNPDDLKHACKGKIAAMLEIFEA